MRRVPSKLPRFLCLCLLAWALAPSGAGAASGGEWWQEGASHRLVVEAVPPGRRAGINTARVSMAEQSQLCRPDGGDVRVFTADGEPVPHRVEIRDNKALDVVFRVPSDAERFHVYYCAPEAAPPAASWDQNLGGLFLETRPIERQIRRPSDLRRAVRRYRKRFDRQPWTRIWDLENPFGPDDLYMSIYEGTLYCPESGEYEFAINADDVAYFAIEDVANPLCWRQGGVPSLGWHDPKNPRAVREVTVEEGVYHVRYHHAENYGQQLAKLGWRLPSSDVIVAVPGSAFVSYLPVHLLARDVRGQEVSPFFAALHRYTTRINGAGPGFPFYRFEARMIEPIADQGWRLSWDFGDGQGGSGRVVEHEYARVETYQVALTVTAPDGSEGQVVRPVTPPPGAVRDVTLEMQVRAGDRLLRAATPLELRILVSARGISHQDFELLTRMAAGQEASSPGQPRRRPLEFAPPPSGGGARSVLVEESFPIGRQSAEVEVAVVHRGVEAAAEQIAVRRTDAALPNLRLDVSGELRDEGGRLVVLRLADLGRAEAPARRICETRGGTVNALVLDDLLGGPPGRFERQNYADLLARMLAGRYPELEFRFERVGSEGDDELSPLQRFLQVRDRLTGARPNLVLIVCQPESVVNGVPLEDFADALGASLDHVLGRTRAEVMVVGPPPLPGTPDAARPYAEAAKRVGLRRGVPVVDLYSRFLLTDGWEDWFRPVGGRRPSFLLYPNETGQEAVAREVYAAVLGSFHQELSAAVRKVSLLRAGAEER
jgi:hypothetical protein